MSSLEAELQKVAAASKLKIALRAGKPRLCADPSIGSGDLMEVLRQYLTFQETKDLASCIFPGKHLKLSWKSGVDPDFLVKISGLSFDLIKLVTSPQLEDPRQETEGCTRNNALQKGGCQCNWKARQNIRGQHGPDGLYRFEYV